MSIRLHAVSAIVALGLVAAASAGPILNPGNYHYYQLQTSQVTWAQAFALSRIVLSGVTGHLATITSEQENSFVASLLGPDCYHASLGGTDDGSEGTWRWITGEPFVYSNWFAGEPNNQFGGENWMTMSGPVLANQLGTWSDGHGENIYSIGHYVIEWDEPANGWPQPVLALSGVHQVPGDYDGDKQDDLAIYDPNTGDWYILSLANITKPIVFKQNWGFPGAIPVAGDYDGDGRSDLAVYEKETGFWYILSLANLKPIAFGQQWGGQGMNPVPGDYDKDGKSDLAVYQAASAKWYILSLTNPTKPIVFGLNWGW
jgi:hypothetical protein